MPVCRSLVLSSRARCAALAAAALLTVAPAPLYAAAFSWITTSPGTAAWATPDNWTGAPGYPGATAAGDTVTIAPGTALSGALTINYTGIPAPSLGALTLARGFTTDGDVLRLAINAPLTLGTLTLDRTISQGAADLYVDVYASSAFNSINLVRTDTADVTPNAPGLRILGGTSTVGNFQISSATSSMAAQTNTIAAATISAGTLTVNGPTFAVGQQNGTNNSASLFVTGGTLIATNPAGLSVAQAIAPNHGPTAGTVAISGGTVVLPKLSLGGTQTSTFIGQYARNSATLSLTGGALYLGSGGIVATSAFATPGQRLGSLYSIFLGAGTLGATSHWTSTASMTLLPGLSPTTLHAADPANAPFKITLSGPLTGAGAIRKTGPGTLTLTGTSSTYSGGTRVAQGTLLLAAPVVSGGLGPTGTGPITVDNSATLGGSSSTAGIGDVTINPGGHLSPGLPDVNGGIGTLALHNLTLAQGAFVDFDFAPDPSSHDLIQILPDYTLTLGNPVHVNLLQLGQPFATLGTYTLFTGFSSLVGGASNLLVSNPAPNTSYNFTLDAADILLTIAPASAGPLNALWTGAAGTDWGSSSNWIAGQVPGNTMGDQATFPSNASSFAVALNGQRRLASLTLNPGNNPGYTFISGSPGASLILDNGTAPASLIITSGANSFAHDVLLVSPLAAVVSPGAQLSLSGAVSGGPFSAPTLSLSGGGTLAFSGNTAIAGPTNISGGALQLSGTASFTTIAGTGALHVDGGTTVSDAITVDSWAIAGTHRLRPRGDNSGVARVGTLTLAGNPGAWSGKLDLADYALILPSSSEAAQAALASILRDQVASGRNGGMWNGSGITSASLTSSTFAAANTLAVIDAGDINLSTFRGQTGLDASTTIVTLAHLGDATLDGKVDTFDLNILAAHWQQSDAFWTDGDFTGDGKVDTFDLNALAAQWQYGTGANLSTSLAEIPQINGFAAPEPSSGLICALVAPTLLIRRKLCKKNSQIHLHTLGFRGINFPNLF